MGAIHRPKTATLDGDPIASVVGVSWGDTAGYQEPVKESNEDEPTGHVDGGMTELAVTISCTDPTDGDDIIGNTGALVVVARGSCGKGDKTYTFANTGAWHLNGTVTIASGETVFRYSGRYYSNDGTTHPRSVS